MTLEKTLKTRVIGMVQDWLEALESATPAQQSVMGRWMTGEIPGGGVQGSKPAFVGLFGQAKRTDRIMRQIGATPGFGESCRKVLIAAARYDKLADFEAAVNMSRHAAAAKLEAGVAMFLLADGSPG